MIDQNTVISASDPLSSADHENLKIQKNNEKMEEGGKKYRYFKTFR